MYRLFFKRFFDLIISITALIVISPLFLGIFLILLFYNKGNPFFFQERPGYKARVFKVIKFKSMVDKFGPDGKPLPDRERITRVGTFIRKTSLDELPQLINVLKGDMSFIGPRPLLIRYLPYYTEREAKRHDVRPGMTGLSQISGRNNLNWEERLELDVQYVENLSFMLDVQIIVKSIFKVLKGSDVQVIPRGKFFDVHRSEQGLVN